MLSQNINLFAANICKLFFAGPELNNRTIHFVNWPILDQWTAPVRLEVSLGGEQSSTTK